MKVGEVVTGAAMAAGAVMLCCAAFGNVNLMQDVIEPIGNFISGLFAAKPTDDPGLLAKFGEWLGKPAGQAIAGATLLGGGYMAYSGIKSGREAEERMSTEAALDAAANNPVEGGYAEQIAMNRGIMRCRAAMMSQNPELCAGAAIRG